MTKSQLGWAIYIKARSLLLSLTATQEMPRAPPVQQRAMPWYLWEATSGSQSRSFKRAAIITHTKCF